MDNATRKKWDFSATFYDLLAWGPERRWAPRKRELFANMHGRVLFAAIGTGQDIPFFPPGQDITAIDISPRMLAKAAGRAAHYAGVLELREMDIHALEFPEHSFDQVVTSCTFCSVPDPVAGLVALRRVLKPGGELYMFEHTGSRVFPFRQMLDVMTPLWKPIGPEMNRIRSRTWQRPASASSGSTISISMSSRPLSRPRPDNAGIAWPVRLDGMYPFPVSS